jgi:hypothetical protein
MAKSRSYESGDFYNRKSEGLRQRRLKEESRWKFDPGQDYTLNAEDEDLLDDEFDETAY